MNEQELQELYDNKSFGDIRKIAKDANVTLGDFPNWREQKAAILKAIAESPVPTDEPAVVEGGDWEVHYDLNAWPNWATFLVNQTPEPARSKLATIMAKVSFREFIGALGAISLLARAISDEEGVVTTRRPVATTKKKVTPAPAVKEEKKGVFAQIQQGIEEASKKK